MSNCDSSEVIDAILANVQQPAQGLHTNEEVAEIKEFCKSINEALEVYSVKGIDVCRIVEDGTPNDIAAFKQRCRAVLDDLKKATRPDVAVREAKSSLQSISNDVRDEIGSRFTFGSNDGSATVAIDFFQDGFTVKDLGAEDGTLQAIALLDAGVVEMWRELSFDKRVAFELPNVPKLDALRPYDLGTSKSFFEEIRRGVLPQELRKRDRAGTPVPTCICINDFRKKTSHENLIRVIDALGRMHKQQEGERVEAEKLRLEAARKEQEEAERKVRQDRLLALEEASRAKLKEMEEVEAAMKVDDEAKQAEEKHALISTLVTLRNKYKEQDLTGLITCLSTLQTYLKNVANNPEEPKYRRINTENNAFKKRVAEFDGAVAVLQACGFHEEASALVYSDDVAKSSGGSLADAVRKIDILVDQLKR